MSLPVSTRYWQAAFWLCWCSATVLMVLPATELPVVDIWDKAEHAGTFFGLMLLACLAYQKQVPPTTLALCLAVYGVAIECIQFFIPSRSFSVWDMVADGVGIVAMWCIHRVLQRRAGPA